ncbi:carboxypeptidase M32, partial [bacterium]|nr:carboxypeptidase M32 [bacterium]
MEQKLEQLKTILAEITDLGGAVALLGWDQQTYMPPGGAEARGNQLGTLQRLIHERQTSAAMGKLLEELKPHAAALDPDSDDARLVKVVSRDYDIATRVPAEWVVEFAQVTTMAQQAWIEARTKSEFSIFRPHLEKIVELGQRYVSFFPPADHPYDILLDIFEPGMKTA